VVRSVAFAANARLAPGKDAKPEVVSLKFDAQLEKPTMRFDTWPAVSVESVHLAGDSETARLDVVDIKTGPLRVPTLLVTARQILGANPTAEGKFSVLTRLGDLPGFLKSLPTPVVLPQDLDWSKFAGDLRADITASVDLVRMPDLAAVSADMRLHVGDISAPALPGRLETGPGDFEGHLVFKNSAADFEATLTTDIQRGFDLIDGPVKARFSAHGEVAGKAEAAVALDLKGARMRAPAGLAWEKAAGVESSVQAKVATSDFHLPGNEASATFDVAANGLIYQRIGVKGRVDAMLNPGGPPAAVKLVCDSIEADATSLRLEAYVSWPKSVQLSLSGARLDLRPLIALAAPKLAVLNVPAVPLPKAAGPVTASSPVSAPPVAAASPAAATTGEAAGAATPTSLPTSSKVKVDVQEIALGGGRTITPFKLQAEFSRERPVTADLTFESLGHEVRATLDGGPDHPLWSLQIGEVADLLAVVTAPFKELPASMKAPDTSIGGMLALPEKFIGGRLTAAGTLDPGNPAGLVQGQLQVADLRLRTEIPFLSSIAGLVKRDVKITVPFKEFRIGSFTLGQHEAHVLNGFVAGPINFTAEKIDFDMARSELFLRGKIIGIWFEVKGQPGNLEYYLADKNPGLNLITTGDEFQW
jgi:hypothetical protein